MGARKRPAAEPRVLLQPCGAHEVDLGRALAVPELANVEMAFDSIRPFAVEPAEKDVAGGLHESLAHDHPMPLMVVLARSGERLRSEEHTSELQSLRHL